MVSSMRSIVSALIGPPASFRGRRSTGNCSTPGMGIRLMWPPGAASPTRREGADLPGSSPRRRDLGRNGGRAVRRSAWKILSQMKGLFWKIVIEIRWRLPRRHREGALVEERVPDFTLRDLSGRPFTLSDQVAKSRSTFSKRFTRPITILLRSLPSRRSEKITRRRSGFFKRT